MRVADAAHQVLAVGDLRVHHRLGGQHRAGVQVAQVRGNGGAADVDRQRRRAPSW